MFRMREGRCDICGQVPTATSSKTRTEDLRLHIDHDHGTGEVRGLLCRRCNNNLGWYEAHRAGVSTYMVRYGV